MTVSQSQFFYSHHTVNIQKNYPEKEKSIRYLKFLLLLVQIIYLFNIQWLASHLHPSQTHYVKNLYVLCEGILIFITLTIHLLQIMKYELPLHNNSSGKALDNH